VDGLHDLVLHQEDRQRRSLLAALHQTLVHLITLRPVVEDILQLFWNS
jgi:hypothetical protein